MKKEKATLEKIMLNHNERLDLLTKAVSLLQKQIDKLVEFQGLENDLHR